MQKDNRIEPICAPGLSPKFQFDVGEKVFTSGSCFARNVEDALVEKGFDVVNTVANEFGRDFAVSRRGILNNYNVASMFNELDWALDTNHPFEEVWNYSEASPGKYVDLNLAMGFRPAPYDEVRKRRDLILSIARRASECSIVIMTLGLVEAWHDKQTGRYLNFTPPLTVASKFPQRFELHVLDYDTTVDYLEKMVALLRATARQEQKTILTVSPVPLLTTFTENDVVIANCYSKSVLRVAAEHMRSNHANIDYCPSYESVTLSDRKITWNDDQHHVEDAIVKLNVGRMISAYVSRPEEQRRSALKEEAMNLRSKGDFAGAYAILEGYAEELTEPAELLIFAEACPKLKMRDRALSALRKTELASQIRTVT